MISSRPEDCYEPPDLREALRSGKAIVGHCGFTCSREWAAKVAGETPHEVWYTERNGDSITLIVPAGTQPDQFPGMALGYMVARWIKPEDEFGAGCGVVPVRWRRS